MRKILSLENIGLLFFARRAFRSAFISAIFADLHHFSPVDYFDGDYFGHLTRRLLVLR